MIDRKLLNTSGIYMIRNDVNGKVYVGQSCNILRRYLEHRTLLRKGKHYNGRLQGSWNMHGEEAFSVHVGMIAYGMLDRLEKIEIDKRQSFDDKFGYNIAIETGNAWRKGAVNSPAHRAAVSAAKRGKPGHKHTPESREAIRKAHIGKVKSDEHRKNLSLALTGNKPANLGVPHSDTAKRRMREAKAKIEWNGQLTTLRAVSEAVGIERATLAHRMKKLKMTLEQAIATPLRPRKDRKEKVAHGIN